MPPPPNNAPASLRALRLYYFGSFAAFGAYLPLFPRWLEAQGVRGLEMGAVSATLPAMGVLAPPAFGFIADALGLRGRLIRVACAGAFLAFAFIAICAALGPALGFVGLFFAVLVFAFFRAPMVQLADVIALETASGAGTTYGRLRLWGSLGFALMAMAAGAFIDPARPAQLPGVIACCLSLACALSLVLPAHAGVPRGAAWAAPRLSDRLRAMLRSRDVQLFLAASFLAQGAHSTYDLCFSLHLRDIGFPPGLLGVAWAVGVCAEVVLMAFSGQLLARAPAPTLLAAAFAGASLRWALLATVRWAPALLALQPLHAVSFAIMWVSSLAYLKDRAPPHVLATAQGLFSASTGAGSVIGMLAWGPLYRRAGGAVTFGVASVVAGTAFALAVPFARAALRRGGDATVFSAAAPDEE